MKNTPKKSPINSESPKESQVKMSRVAISLLLIAAVVAFFATSKCDGDKEQTTDNKPTPDDVSNKVPADSGVKTSKDREKLHKALLGAKVLLHQMNNQPEPDGDDFNEEAEKDAEETDDFREKIEKDIEKAVMAGDYEEAKRLNRLLEKYEKVMERYKSARKHSTEM